VHYGLPEVSPYQIFAVFLTMGLRCCMAITPGGAAAPLHHFCSHRDSSRGVV